ncbi:hypothetical protein [Caldimonas brevitalea]|uniref:hypothetical protein n=1 Tax=Caldimonas brevitalea TaxID=413882 RepID=UPI003AA9181F
MAVCAQPGVSMAAVALSRGINANLMRNRCRSTCGVSNTATSPRTRSARTKAAAARWGASAKTCSLLLGCSSPC